MQRDPSFAYSQEALYQVLHDKDCSPRVHGAIYEHRLACARYIRTEPWRLLDDPALTRGKLRQELDRLCKQVEEHGPPSEPRAFVPAVFDAFLAVTTGSFLTP